MSLVGSISDLEAALRTKDKKRNKQWAHGLCTLSRFIHINVWRFCPEREKVERQVIPLLHKAQQDGIVALIKSGRIDRKDCEEIAQYARNIGFRIDNLRNNYLRGKPSNFLPDDKLTGKQPKVG